jgi:hypothetical protein
VLKLVNDAVFIDPTGKVTGARSFSSKKPETSEDKGI